MSETMEPTLPDIDGILEAFRPPTSPAEALEKHSGALAAVRVWKMNYAAGVLAGLMTEVRYHANTIRLDWLLRLVIATSRGQKKPMKGEVESVLNKGLETASVLRLEDPIEDLFCEVVPTDRGDRLIFSGHWEQASAYTDTVLQAFEELPDAALKRTAVSAAHALLHLSDVVAHRSGTERRAHGGGTPGGVIALPTTERMRQLARRVRFTEVELDRLGIQRAALEPFILRPEQYASVAQERPGDSPLEFCPLIEVDGGILVVSPGTISLAVRSVLLHTAKSGGVGDMLVSWIAVKQEEYAESSGFWPGPDIRLSPPDEHGVRTSVCRFAPGRYLHIIQFTTGLHHFPMPAFGAPTPLPAGAAEGIGKEVARFWDFLSQQPDHRESISVLLMCGWGAAQLIARHFDDRASPRGWRFLPLTFADAALLGGCADGKLRDVWRVQEQIEILEAVGYSVANVNGTVNLFGNWRATGGNFIPEHMQGIDPPCMVWLPTDDLFEPRLESATNRDVRTLPFGDTSKKVQRIEWGQDENLSPIYGSLSDAADRRLLGAVALSDRTWWIEATQAQAGAVSREWQYHLWNAALQWLGASAQLLIEECPDLLPAGSVHVCLQIEGDGSASEDLSAREIVASPDLHLVIPEREPDQPAIVRIEPGWSLFLQRPANDAEFALALAILKQICAKGRDSLSVGRLASSLRHAIPSADWRWLHARQVITPLERLNEHISSFREIPRSARALVRCGSVWRFRDQAQGNELEGEEECRKFLVAYYDFILRELIAHIRQFNREQLVVASARRYNSGRLEQTRWRTSIRALRSIRGKAADGAALDRQSSINAVQRAAKAVCEIAACEAPGEGGAQPGSDDLDEMYARALLLFGNGQLYATMRAGMVKPLLRISPAGDLLSDRSAVAKVFAPATEKFHTRHLDEASQTYVDRANGEQPPSGKESLPWSDDMRLAVEAEYDASAEGMVDLQFAVLQMAEERQTDVFLMERSALAETLSSIVEYPDVEALPLLKRLTLGRRDDWASKPDSYSDRDLDLSRFDRTYSLINRPLLAISDEPDPVLVVSPILISDSTFYALHSLQQGTLHDQFWVSAAARGFAGRRAKERGREFEDDVTKRLSDAGFNATARRSISALLLRQVEQDLGDVDVFAIGPSGSTVWVLETKNLRLCRTEVEVAARMTEYRGEMRHAGKRGEKPDKMLRHLTRVRYLRENSVELGNALGLATAPTVRGMIVVDAPQPMAFQVENNDPDGVCCMVDDLVALMREPPAIQPR